MVTQGRAFYHCLIWFHRWFLWVLSSSPWGGVPLQLVCGFHPSLLIGIFTDRSEPSYIGVSLPSSMCCIKCPIVLSFPKLGVTFPPLLRSHVWSECLVLLLLHGGGFLDTAACSRETHTVKMWLEILATCYDSWVWIVRSTWSLPASLCGCFR